MGDRPTILKDWQTEEQPEPQPSCYEARNPAAPWMAAAPQLDDGSDDIEFARDWVRSRTNTQSCGVVVRPPAVPDDSRPVSTTNIRNMRT